MAGTATLVYSYSPQVIVTGFANDLMDLIATCMQFCNFEETSMHL